MRIFGREPVFWVSVIAALILGALETLFGFGLVSDALKGQVTDFVKALVQLIILIIPVFAGIISRQAVTPLSDPRNADGNRLTP